MSVRVRSAEQYVLRVWDRQFVSDHSLLKSSFVRSRHRTSISLKRARWDYRFSVP